MAQTSLLWTDSTGDGGPYTRDELRMFLKAIHGADHANAGVLRRQLNELLVSVSGADTIAMATGRALVNGTLYENDASTTLAMTRPTVGTTGWIAVLRKSWSAQTIRLAITRNTDNNAAIPSLTQSDGVTWEIPLAAGTITTAGTVTITKDLRHGIGEWVPDEWINQAMREGGTFPFFSKNRLIGAIYSDWSSLDNTNEGSSIGLQAPLVSAAWDVSVSPAGRRLHFTPPNTTAHSMVLGTAAAQVWMPQLNPRFAIRCHPTLAPESANYANLTRLAIGMLDGTASGNGLNSGDGVAFRKATSGNWFFVTREGGAETTTDLGFSEFSANDYLEVFTRDRGVSWEAWRNGAQVARHTTNIPSVTDVSQAPAVSVYANGGSAGDWKGPRIFAASQEILAA